MKAIKIFFAQFIIFFLLVNNSFACLSITDDFNSQNPIINAIFNFSPDVGPFTDCWSGVIRIRSSQDNWRLIASRSGPSPTTNNGNSDENIKPSDVAVIFELKNFGMVDPNGAILVSPFSYETDLSSIQSGTLIVSGMKKTSNSCSSFNPNFYKLTKKLCLFRDFIFNIGQYNGQISYLLIRP